MAFREFCERLATEIPITITETEALTGKYLEPANVTINLLKNKVDRFDSVKVPYVEAVFDDKEWETKLNEKCPDGEIPDELINHLSIGIFKESPSSLEVWQQAIIKVLSTYICIQN